MKICYFLTPRLMENLMKFLSSQTFLELHSKTTLRHSPKQPNKLGICFKKKIQIYL